MVTSEFRDFVFCQVTVTVVLTQQALSKIKSAMLLIFGDLDVRRQQLMIIQQKSEIHCQAQK